MVKISFLKNLFSIQLPANLIVNYEIVKIERIKYAELGHNGNTQSNRLFCHVL